MKGSDAQTDNPSVEKDNNIKPHPHDILCGRGGQSNNHPGNEWFRRLVRSNRALYRSCPKHTKLLVAKAIVQAVQQQEPPGRFIKLIDSDNNASGEWAPITYGQAVNKTSQALREKEPSAKRSSKKVQPPPPPKQRRKSLQGEQQEQPPDQPKFKETAKDSPKRVQFDAESVKPTKVQPHKRKNAPATTTATTTEENQQDSVERNTQAAGKKRKMAEGFVKPSWWGVKPIINRVIATGNTGSDGSKSTKVLGPIVTPVNNDSIRHGTKRMKVQSEAETKGTNEGYEINNTGRSELNQSQTEMDPGPLPIETSLVSRQSSMFRFLSNTGIFGRGSSVVVAQPPPLGRANSTVTDPVPNDFQSEQWSQQMEDGNVMGKTSVQQLRSRQLEHQQNESNMEDMPTSGLIDGCDVAQPPKALKSQMSDWLTSFFPASSMGDDGTMENTGRSTPIVNNFKPQSAHDDIGEAAMPPPPGGGRSVSSAILGLVESPSLLLTTLKSGVSSLFGDSLFSQQDDTASMTMPMRRFPSSFQQQQQQQPQNQEKGGFFTTAGATFGNQHQARDSLLDDVEETDDVRKLRNVGPAVAPTGPPRFY